MSGGGGVRGHKIKSLGGLSKGWTDWHQLWYTSVDSSGNGLKLKQFAPRYSRAAIWVVLWDQQFKRVGNVVKRLDRLGINFAHVIGPMRHQGEHFDVGVGAMFWVLRGSTFHQKSGECHDIQRKQIFLNV